MVVCIVQEKNDFTFGGCRYNDRRKEERKMNNMIDARGKQCPLPVIEAKNAIAAMTEAGTVEVMVDNEIAVQNLSKMANHKGLTARSEKKAEQEYVVWIEVTEEAAKANTTGASVVKTEEQELCTPDMRKKNTVVVLSSDHMGEGDEKLGKMLMKGFVYALTQLHELPKTILLFNAGAYLSCEDSDSLEDLKSMEAQGVEILTCGTCLNHYGLTEKLAVGTVTNMYVIAQTMMEADHIVKP